MTNDVCPCGSGKAYAGCCGMFISGKDAAPTAEALMRSRFSAYTVKAVEYLVRTTHPASRTNSLAKSISATANTYTWLSLQVVWTQAGCVKDKVGKVEFTAHFRGPDGNIGAHHERSRFKKHAGEWYYLDGEEL